MSTDLLDGARPKRLIQRQGRWYLEVARLVSTGDGVFQPRKQRVEGKTAILEALRHSKHGKHLADAAQRIVADGQVEDTSFDAVDGSWIPSRLAPSYIKQLGRVETRTPAEAALIAELTVLRASHEGLMVRVARLERLLADKYDIAEHPFGVKHPRERDRTPIAATLREGVTPEPTEDANAEAPDAERFAPAQEEEPTADARPGLVFPPLGVMTDALKQLCGKDVPLKEMPGAASEWVLSPEGYHVAWLVDDAGEVRAAILWNAEAVARLGGALLDTNQSEIEEQATQQAPSEDAMMAAADMCNCLTERVNEMDGNPHVRARTLAPMENEDTGWLESPAAQLISAHPGGGMVVFVSR